MEIATSTLTFCLSLVTRTLLFVSVCYDLDLKGGENQLKLSLYKNTIKKPITLYK